MSLAVRKAKDQLGSVRLSCRVSPVTKSRAEQAARALGQTVTHFTEEAISKRAEEVLTHESKIILSERDFARFVELIETPKPPTQNLRDLMSEYQQLKTSYPEANL